MSDLDGAKPEESRSDPVFDSNEGPGQASRAGLGRRRAFGTMSELSILPNKQSGEVGEHEGHHFGGFSAIFE